MDSKPYLVSIKWLKQKNNIILTSASNAYLIAYFRIKHIVRAYSGNYQFYVWKQVVNVIKDTLIHVIIGSLLYLCSLW